MKSSLLGLTTVILGTSAVIAAPMPCADITTDALGLSGVTFTEVTDLQAGEKVPATMCQIRGKMAERTGSDGKPYALAFEISLPKDWNGDFVHQFNGGNDGEVKPATGALPAGTGTKSPVALGYAVISSDAGHNGKANPDAGLAGGARFGFDFEARKMYGYKAVATLDPVARQIVEGVYGVKIDKAYGVGCSNGGRHAMVAASRMPDAFDGLLVGAPGFNLPKAALQHALDVQSFASVNKDIAQSFTREDLTILKDGMLAVCDGLDGLEDGIVADTAACQAAFDVTALRCNEGQNSACLSPAQVSALATIHKGTDGEGAPYYSDWSWDPAIATGGWRFWKLESPIPPWGKKPIISVMGSSSLAQVFTTPPTEVAGSPDELEAFLVKADISKMAKQIYATTASFPESAMEVMTPPNSENPTLEAFQSSGGKMIVFHGVGDPVFSVNDTANWYAKLDRNNAGKAGDFAKFYPVPGMTHCRGGVAAEGFDLFASLVDWVERNNAPEQVIATIQPQNRDVPPALAGATRPLCPSPKVARYKGGDSKSAESFVCE